MVAFAIGYFAYLLFFAGLNTAEQKRVLVMIALFVACAMFWAGFEQTGASLNLFADRYTDRNYLRLGHAGRRAAERESVLHHHLLARCSRRYGCRSGAAISIRRRRRNSHWDSC